MFEHNFPTTHTVPLHKGDTQYITHSTVLREEMVVGFIDHLSCHLQRLEWRTEAVFELMRVDR